MTKEINKIIRSLKRAQKELTTVDTDIIFGQVGDLHDIGMAQYHITSMIVNLEEKYREIHKIGSHDKVI